MAKLTKTQKRDIQGALDSVTAALKFINSDRIALCHAQDVNAETYQGPDTCRAREPHRVTHHTGNNDSEWSINWIKELTPMDKGVGSDFVRLYTAQSILTRLLDYND